MIMSDGYDENGNPTIISLEDGRLWFVAGGQRVDVTDQVDEETPYVHTATDEEGNLHYIIVGGTPEDYGWFEGVTAPDAAAAGAEYSTAGPTCPTSRWTYLVYRRQGTGPGAVKGTTPIKHAVGRGRPRPVFAHSRAAGVPPLRFYKNIFESLNGRVLDPPLPRIRSRPHSLVIESPRRFAAPL